MTDAAAELARTAGWDRPSRLTRVDEQQTDNDFVPKLWQSTDARLLSIDPEGRMSVDGAGKDGDRPTLRLTTPSGAYDSQRHFLLGYVDGAPHFVTLSDTSFDAASAAGLREIGPQLGELDRDLGVAAAALTNWHRGERFCPRCGCQTDVRKAGYLRLCPDCGKETFPRTDPAVIVAIIDDEDRILLGGQTSWGNRISVFAGFVEAGESAEQAVHREMAEEVGVSLREVSYFGSQPWPFPRSLMLGFVARADSSRVTVGDEISHADWFTRERLEQEAAEGIVALPTPMSIAHRLVTAWRAGLV